MTQLTETIYSVTVPKECKPENYKVNVHVAQFNRNNLFKYSILGTVTSESIDFDVKAIVGKPLPGGYLFNYNRLVLVSETPDASFRSLLSSKGVVLRENEKLIIIQKR